MKLAGVESIHIPEIVDIVQVLIDFGVIEQS
jgi:hypothetical protein